jgi:hypothetical protein
MAVPRCAWCQWIDYELQARGYCVHCGKDVATQAAAVASAEPAVLGETPAEKLLLRARNEAAREPPDPEIQQALRRRKKQAAQHHAPTATSDPDEAPSQAVLSLLLVVGAFLAFLALIAGYYLLVG